MTFLSLPWHPRSRPGPDRPRSRGLLLLLLLLPLALLAGCEQESVQTYTVPHVPEVPQDRVRLLGALISRPDAAWSFKLVGSNETVTQAEGAFNSLIRSVRFANAEGAPTWTAPEGWKEEKGGGEFRLATLKQEKGRLEIVISQLSAKGGDVLGNVVRWRRNDLGLGPIGPASLPRYTSEEEIGGQVVTFVKNMTGPGPRKGRPGMAGMGRRPGPLPITYKAPEGWRETGPRGGIVPVLTAFQLEQDGQKAEVTVTPPGTSGGMLANYNRWRDQVGLGKLSDAEFAKVQIPVFKLGGVEGKYVDLTGPPGEKQQRMLLVQVSRGKGTWYFKMRGDAALVEKQRGPFESFLQSVQFTGAADE